MKEAGYGVLLALQFLTRLPIPLSCPWTPSTRRWAIRAFPWMGALIGLALAAVTGAVGEAWPTPLLALTLLSLWVGLSGGLHLDGLMDLADAVGSNASRERRWEIMQDPRVGSFAVLVLVFQLSWKGILLWGLLDGGASPWALIAVPALARLGAVALLVTLPSARPRGMARAWQQGLGPPELGWTALPTLVLLALPGVGWLVLPWGAFMLAYGVWVQRNFGGISGDLVGAAIEGGETWLLFSLWIWWSCVMA